MAYSFAFQHGFWWNLGLGASGYALSVQGLLAGGKEAQHTIFYFKDGYVNSLNGEVFSVRCPKCHQDVKVDEEYLLGSAILCHYCYAEVFLGTPDSSDEDGRGQGGTSSGMRF